MINQGVAYKDRYDIPQNSRVEWLLATLRLYRPIGRPKPRLGGSSTSDAIPLSSGMVHAREHTRLNNSVSISRV